jgi:hypothetical protein
MNYSLVCRVLVVFLFLLLAYSPGVEAEGLKIKDAEAKAAEAKAAELIGAESRTEVARRMKVNLGYGIWESFHVGMDYRFSNYSLGLDLGTSFHTLPFENSFVSVTIDNTFYWGKANKYELKTWYFNSRVIYYNAIEPSTTWNVVNLCPGIGKEFCFNESFGMNLDLGLALVVFAHRQDNTSNISGWIYPVYPECRVELFYRF